MQTVNFAAVNRVKQDAETQMTNKNFGTAIILSVSANAYASYMGGPEVFEYFWGVLFSGGVVSIFLSIVRDNEGRLVGFKPVKFILLVALAFCLAIFAGLLGLAVGRR